jgi:RNA polymerase sigma-70 factor (ECF subfamily)
MNTDEQAMVQRWCKGDVKAFEFLVHKYMRRAYFIALGMVGQHEDALDLSQEAFVRVHRHRRTFDPTRRFFPWLYQVLKNLCFTYLKERKNNCSVPLEELTEENGEQEESRYVNPDCIAERNDVRDAVWKAISALKPQEREIIILRHFQELSYREISELLSCSQGTVMSRLYYARKALRRKLERTVAKEYLIV